MTAPAVRAYRPPAPLGGRPGARTERRRTLTALAFLAPALIILGLFVAWPMVSALRLSFTDASGFGAEEWVGLDNYIRVFTDPDIRDAMGNTLWYTVLFTPTAVVSALLLALILNSPSLPFRGFFRTTLFLPFIVSLARRRIRLVATCSTRDSGCSTTGCRTWASSWATSSRTPCSPMPAVAMVAVWKNFGFYMVIFLAGLQDIPASTCTRRPGWTAPDPGSGSATSPFRCCRTPSPSC